MQSQQKKISVIVPVYNTGNYLSRCLNSIINCNYKNLEIICVDDGSNDNSIDILKEYEIRDSRIRIVNKENGGSSSARNAGISASTGEYINFIDSDDWIHPDCFNILTKYIDTTNDTDIDVVICGFKQTDTYSTDFIKYGDKEINEETYEVNPDILFHEKKLEMFKVYSCGALYKKEKIFNLFPEGVKNIEDNIFNLLNLPVYNQILIINLPLYFYYINNKSIMHTYSCDDAFGGLIWFCKWLDENHSMSKKQKALIVEFIYKRSFYYRYAFFCLGHTNETKKYIHIIFKCLERHDDCLNKSERLTFHFLKNIPAGYDLIKFLKDGQIKEEDVFSLAPNKLMKNELQEITNA